MITYMEELSMAEAENLKKTISRLFRQTCILQMRYDPVTLAPRDNPDYETCIRHREFIENYLSVLGCELEHDPQEHIFRLKGEGAETEKISQTTTMIILLVRMIYRDKILGEGLHATVTNLKEIREYGANTGLLDRKLTTAEWRDTLYLMNRHQMIELPGSVRDVKDETPIYLYSTILLYVSAADMNQMIEEYREEIAEDEAIKEIIPADAAQ
ncbi:MAG: DUF4194 domain-containing protein [Ruminococcus sp.]|nr:DUF4194 domain-containing protein [Ruminococcus sp.]